MTTDGVLTMIVVEDQKETRESLRALIDGTDGYRCLGTFDSVEAALAEKLSETPQTILLDIGLPGVSGIDGLPLLQAKYPQAAVLMLTVYEDNDRIFAALCAGASGYLLKKTTPQRLLENVKEGVSGGSPMSPEVARKVIEEFRKGRQLESTVSQLTAHELRILKLVADGHNYTTASHELKVSINTLSFHMKQIYEKLHVHSKSQAVAKALRAGFFR